MKTKFLMGLALLMSQFAAASPTMVTCDFGKAGSVTFMIDLKSKIVDTKPRTEEGADNLYIAPGSWKLIGADRKSIPDVSRYDQWDFEDLTLSLKGNNADDTEYRVSIFFGIQNNPKVRATLSVLPFDDSWKMLTYSAQNCSVKNKK